MKVRSLKGMATFAAVAAVTMSLLGSCSNDPSVTGLNPTGSNIDFHQIDHVGNPGTTELFVPYAQHQSLDVLTPQAEASPLAADIEAFMTGFAGRSQGIAQYAAQNLLTPDVLLADFSQPINVPAGIFGVQTQGLVSYNCRGSAPSTPPLFGGRALTDDAATAVLMIAFGNVVPKVSAALAGKYPSSSATPVPDDNKETPSLESDNVSCSDKTFTLNQFPYIGAPPSS